MSVFHPEVLRRQASNNTFCISTDHWQLCNFGPGRTTGVISISTRERKLEWNNVKALCHLEIVVSKQYLHIWFWAFVWMNMVRKPKYLLGIKHGNGKFPIRRWISHWKATKCSMFSCHVWWHLKLMRLCPYQKKRVLFYF